MGQYQGVINWANNVYEYDVTDPVIGGPDGTANKPLHDLADRTAWLKSQLGIFDRLAGEVVLTASAPIGANLAGNLITVYATGINNFQLDDAHSFEYGAVIPFVSFSEPGAVNNILTQAGQTIFSTDGGISRLSMHHKEQLFLVALTDHWKVIYGPGNFNCVGEEVKSRKQLNNTLVFKGQLINRAQYPRLTDWVLSNLTMYQEIVPESLWFQYGLTYQSCFTDGDGATTIRLPDERGMFERMLDLGRGVDLNRQHNFAGGYEADDNKQHSHTYRDRYFAENPTFLPNSPNKIPLPLNYNNNKGSGSTDGDDTYALYIDDSTGNQGSEARPKNVAKLNLIKF